ncbi:MAG TPA: hypothetical protein VI942_14065, partial [Thermoanaerobaculia bacterium]|nr:hypothetical protein [Thermoanaerobaculia bacterium]
MTFAAASPAAAQEGQLGQQGQIWNLGTQETGRRFPTEVTVANKSCRGSHTFSVAIEGIATRFLAITGPTTLAGIRPGQSKATPARLDLTGIEPGVHDGGRVVIRCLDCPPTCNLDYQYIEIRLTVTGPASAAPANDGGGPAATGPAGGAQAASDPDPDGDCEFVPKL